ncbi:MAG: hypothetical protein K5872_03800 [Rhizobiaceae bacterium]|nr:hypothetical protein [Rhizobiaceae bacterium]MCV0405335.1 hypothetical protein [Rhizobiaceae bacterium]
MPQRYPSITTALALAASLGWSAASAQDADAVGERLKSTFHQQGVELNYATISGDASEMTLEGVTVKPVGEDEALPLGPIVLTDVAEDGDLITIGSLAMDSHSVSRDGIDVSIEGIEITSLSLPPEGSDEVPLYETADLGSLTISSGGKDVFTLTDMSVEVTPPEDGTALEFTGSAASFTADLTAIEDPNTQRVLQELGYQTVTGSLDMAGSWNPEDGRTQISKYDLSVKDAGTIGISLDIGGYTMEFQKALRDTQERMASAGEQDSAAGMAMLGLMQQLTFHGATIRFEDQTLTGKVLDYFAKQQGAQRSDIANQAKAILPFMLAQLNNPEFAAQVSAAASAFLDAPQSLTISAMPASPVPFAMIAAGAMSAPQNLPEQLGVTVSANE